MILQSSDFTQQTDTEFLMRCWMFPFDPVRIILK